MIKIVITILALNFISEKLLAQEDNWDVYLAMYEKGPGSTIINLSAKSLAPDSSHPFVLITGVTFNQCKPDGLPDKEAFDDLYRLEDEITRLLDQYGSNIHVGMFTYQCERLLYFYVKDTIELGNQLSALFAKEFAAYKPYTNIREDKTWDAYQNFLYPNEETLDYMSNSKLVNQLIEAGDNPEKIRQIDHWAYFPSERSRKCFENKILEKGFKIEKKSLGSNEKMPFELQFNREDMVILSEISRITRELKIDAEKCKGDYDGWETFVVK
jgi:regulator of RNase E activity RraB